MSPSNLPLWFLPSRLYPLSSIPLGGLISDPRTPHKDNLPSTPPPHPLTDIIRAPLKDLNLLLSTATSSTPFHLRLTSLLTLTHSHSYTVKNTLIAKTGFEYELSQPREFFSRVICRDELARRWMQRGIEDDCGTYFVTGLRTIVDGKVEVERSEQRTDHLGGGVSLFSMAMPGVQSSSIPGEGGSWGDVGVLAAKGKGVTMVGKWEAPGEQIFAVGYRKVKFRTKVIGRKDVDEARLKGQDVWVLVPNQRRFEDESDELEVVEEVDLVEDEGVKLKEVEDMDEDGDEWGLKSVVVESERWLYAEEEDIWDDDDDNEDDEVEDVEES